VNKHLQDRAAVGNLVVQHDDVLPLHVADERVDDDSVVAHTLLAAGRHRQAEAPSEMRGFLGVAEIG
jgi:hypothetical protein